MYLAVLHQDACPSAVSPAQMIANRTESESIIRILNSLLRSEISATESYAQAIPRFESDVEVLREIAREHGQAVSDLRAAIQHVGGVPEETSGSWPVFPSRPVNGPAQVFGQAVALKALKDVEERGLVDYTNAIKRLNSAMTGWISEKVIPAQVKHISSLEELLARL